MSYFPTTHWSLVVNVAHGSEETARRALEELCRTYWYPLYAYSRAQGDTTHDAEDFIQGFFAELVERNTVARARAERGRFRSFLLQSFKNHRHNQRAHDAAQKRGGGLQILSLDELRAEERFAGEPRDGLTPEKRFERDWAVSVLDEAHQRLARDYAKSGKELVFARLRGFLQASRTEISYASLAHELGRSEDAIKMEVSRMRAQYRKLLRAVVADTLDEPAEVDEELRYLMSVLSS